MSKKIMYNLPENVKFCSECVISNQRPSSYPEFKHTKDRKGARYINFDEKDVCDACNHAKEKKLIDWNQRETELVKLLDQYRSSNGSYDCIIPGSGGKDSAFQSHILKYKYGMNPLTVTWAPIMYTDYGYENWINWIEEGGFDNILIKSSGRVMKKLTKLSIENLLHPFQTFIYGQKNLIPKIAAKFNIPLIFYGENEAEYGNPIADNSSTLRDKSYWVANNLSEMYLAGVSLKELDENHNLSMKDLYNFIPAVDGEFDNIDLKIHYLGYYLRWTPQEAYYYAVENTGFKARPYRSQATYSKYNSIDDKIDDLHYYTTRVKFGLGRASYDASQEIRNKHITRDEAKLLVDKFENEFPDKYFNELMNYLDMKEDYFHSLCDKFRPPHLWKKVNGEWKLRHNVNKTGTDD